MTDFTKKVNEIKNTNPFISNTEIAYQLIADEIINGKFQYGEKINQEQLATNMQMSRTPVRDALIRLEEDAFIMKNEKAGYNVCEFDLKDYIAFNEFRIELETQGAFLAARFITTKEIKLLENNMINFIKACKEQNLKRAKKYDLEFHQIIIEASHNKYLINAYNQLFSKKVYYMRTILNNDELERAEKKHGIIYKAIVSFDEKVAKEAMKNHLAHFVHKA